MATRRKKKGRKSAKGKPRRKAAKKVSKKRSKKLSVAALARQPLKALERKAAAIGQAIALKFEKSPNWQGPRQDKKAAAKMKRLANLEKARAARAKKKRASARKHRMEAIWFSDGPPTQRVPMRF